MRIGRASHRSHMTAGHIDYEALVHEALRAAEQEALRKVVRAVLQQVARSGLTHDHHFYIAFNTQHAGVSLSKRLKEKYPAEMTIVLQHRFWDLEVGDDRFEVKLTFDGIPERLGIPFKAIKVFYDPSVPYGLQFEDADAGAEARRDGASDNEPQGGRAGRPRIVGGEPEGERAERRGERADRGRPLRPGNVRNSDQPSPAPPPPSTASSWSGRASPMTMSA